MGALLNPSVWTVEEYLAAEDAAAFRSEYVNGQVYNMAGGLEAHAAIATNLLAELHSHLRGGPCRVYGSDFLVRIDDRGETFLYYPDLSVVCGPRSGRDRWTDRPKLVVEVLSPSTESTDRREKVPNYRRLASLEEIVLVAAARAEITVYRRADAWAGELYGPGEDVRLASLGLEVPLERVYEEVEFPPAD